LHLELSKLSDMEKRHFFALEDLFAFSLGEHRDKQKLLKGMNETVDDWKAMMAGRSSLEGFISTYIEGILQDDRNKARNLYFFLSPIFFYVHVLYEISRKEWSFMERHIL